tara:strand:- start:2198 stop:2692 length:495 start_codon:yes stop_codon:yes gene_type:complete
MSRSYLLAKEDERRAIEGMSAREKKLHENDMKIMESNNRLALPGSFRNYTPIFEGQFNPSPYEQKRRNYIKSMRVAIPINRFRQQNEAMKSVFLQAMPIRFRPCVNKHIASYLTNKQHNTFAAKHKRKTSRRKISRRKTSKRKTSKRKTSKRKKSKKISRRKNI